jgi:hypothetical protein
VSEDLGSQYTPVDTPKKNNTTTIIIVIVVLILLCCCCVIAGGGLAWTFGDAALELFGI